MSRVSKLGLNSVAQVKEGLRSGNWGLPDVDDLLIRASMNQCTTPAEMLDKMMSPEDVEDLKNGLIPFESLKLHVKVWCEMGKPNQNQLPEVKIMVPATKEEVKEASSKVIEKYRSALDGLASR
jgi:hypothetical protein